MLSNIFGYEHFAAAYWALAFIHAVFFIKLNETVNSREAAFWISVLYTAVFPFIAVVSVYNLSSAILFFILKPSNRGA